LEYGLILKNENEMKREELNALPFFVPSGKMK
jgi:hypothetical protein